MKKIDYDIMDIANRNAEKLSEKSKKQDLVDLEDDGESATEILLFFGIVFTLIVIGSMLGVWQ